MKKIKSGKNRDWKMNELSSKISKKYKDENLNSIVNKWNKYTEKRLMIKEIKTESIYSKKSKGKRQNVFKIYER